MGIADELTPRGGRSTPRSLHGETNWQGKRRLVAEPPRSWPSRIELDNVCNGAAAESMPSWPSAAPQAVIEDSPVRPQSLFPGEGITAYAAPPSPVLQAMPAPSRQTPGNTYINPGATQSAISALSARRQRLESAVGAY